MVIEITENFGTQYSWLPNFTIHHSIIVKAFLQGPEIRVVNSSVEVTELDSGGRGCNPTKGWFFLTHKEKVI